MTTDANIEAFSPGEYIQDELDARGWAQVDLSAILGCPASIVNDVIKGRRPVTPELAKALGDAFGTSAQVWLNTQSAYQLAMSSKKDDDVKRRADLYGRYPIREMAQRRWIEDSTNVEVLETQICQFFDISDIHDRVDLPCAARMSSQYGRETLSHLAWIARVRNLGRRMPVERRYSARNLGLLFDELSLLIE